MRVRLQVTVQGRIGSQQQGGRHPWEEVKSVLQLYFRTDQHCVEEY